MTLDRTPISAWSFVVFGTVGLATLPILVAELAVAYIRIRYGDLADGPSRLVLSGVTDGVSLAPGVYWLAIPVLGLGVEALTTHSSVPLRQHRTVMGLVSAFGVLAFGGHFLAFSSLRASAPFDNGLMVVHLLVVPLVVLATLGVAGAGVRRGRPSLRSPLIASGAAGLILVVATSIMALAQIEHVLRFIDDLFGSSIGVPGWLEVSTTTLQDGVRVLVVGAALIAGVGAVHHWGHKIYGRALDEALGMLSMAALALGTLAWGGADVTSGLLDQPREPVLDGNADSVVEVLNALALLGAVLLAAGAALFVVNLFVSTLARRGDVDEPWRGLTLEWATASPPPRGNFAEQPVVRSATPLADPLPEEEVR